MTANNKPAPPVSSVTGKRLAEPASDRSWEDVIAGIDREEDRGPAWYMVQCVSRTDAAVLDWLKRFEFGTYYPMVREMRRVLNKKLSKKQRRAGVTLYRPQLVPLFPRYVLVRFDMARDNWKEIFAFVGVGGLRCAGDLPVHFSDALIDAIRRREVDGAISGKTPLRTLFTVGEEVRIGDGPFVSFHAVVSELPDRPIEEIDASMLIKVVVDIFGRATPVRMEIGQLEKL